MIATLLFGLVLAAAPESAAATRIVVTVDEPAALPPEVRAEIRDALASRTTGMNVASVEVRLTARSAEILVDGKQASVGVSDWTGEGTMRVVILRVVDLATPPLPLDAPPAATPVAPRAAVVVTPAATTDGDAHATRIVLAAAPLVSRGLSAADGVTEGAEVAATARLGHLLIGVDARWSYGTRHEAGNSRLVTLDMLPVAMVVGRSWEQFEVTAGPFLGPATLWSPAQPSSVGVISGATSGLRWRSRETHRWSWFAAGSVDLYANRRTIEPVMTKYSTPRVAASLAVGVSFGFVP